MDKQTLLQRLKNPGTIVTLVALVCLLLTTIGVINELVSEQVLTVAKIICSIGVVLGIMNNPDNPGLDLPLINQ